jgi:hypothetical protein
LEVASRLSAPGGAHRRMHEARFLPAKSSRSDRNLKRTKVRRRLPTKVGTFGWTFRAMKSANPK